MKNPTVTIDFRNHPLYSTTEFYKDRGYCDVFTAEVLMFNINQGTVRVRLYNKETNELVAKNIDTSVDYIVDNSINIKIR